MQGACAGVCIFEAGRLLSQVPLSDLQEDQELIEERAIGQVMDDHHIYDQSLSVLPLFLRPHCLHEEFEVSHQCMVVA